MESAAEPEAQRAPVEPVEPPYGEAVDSASVTVPLTDHDTEVAEAADALVETVPPSGPLSDLAAPQAAPEAAMSDTDSAEPARSDPAVTPAPVVTFRESAGLDGDNAAPDAVLPEGDVTESTFTETDGPDPVPSTRLPESQVGASPPFTPDAGHPVAHEEPLLAAKVTAHAAEVEEPTAYGAPVRSGQPGPSYPQPSVQPVQPEDTPEPALLIGAPDEPEDSPEAAELTQVTGSRTETWATVAHADAVPWTADVDQGEGTVDPGSGQDQADRDAQPWRRAAVPVRVRSEYPDQPLTTSPEPREQRHRQAVPDATIASFQRMTGVDLGFVPVNRGPIADQSHQFHARAFTAEGEVFIPADRGTLDRADNEALVMHELAHVAQQRLGRPPNAGTGPTPGPGGPEDENQAAMVERAFLGDPVAQDELAHEEWALPGGSMLPPLRSWTPDEGFVSRGVPSAPDLSSAQHAPQASVGVEQEATPRPALPAELAGLAPDLGEAVPLPYPDAPDLEPGGSEGSSADEDRTLLLSDEDVERIARRVRVPLPPPRPVDLEDPTLLEGLALNLYDRIRRMLCSELIVDRERSGVLTELR